MRCAQESARAIKALIDAGRGPEVVAEIVRVSTEGRAPKQTAGIFALAIATRLGDQNTKSAAYAALGQVARTASTLFDFIAYSKALNKEVAEVEGRKVDNASWGRGMRHAVANWYLNKSPMALAYQVHLAAPAPAPPARAHHIHPHSLLSAVVKHACCMVRYSENTTIIAHVGCHNSSQNQNGEECSKP